MDPSDFMRARFLVEAPPGDEYAAIVTLPVSRIQVPVKGEAIVSEFDFAAIEMAEVELGKCLVFVLKPTAARAFYQLSASNLGKRLVLVINGEPIGVRRINNPIADGKVYIFLEVTDSKLEELVERLRETNIEIQKQLNW